MLAEQEKSLKFMKQLDTKIKASKTKTKFTQHKMEWVKKFTSLKKKETELDEFLQRFIKERASGKGWGVDFTEILLDEEEDFEDRK